MSYFTLSNGERLYYEDTESGDQTIVMLHGWTSSHQVFSPIVEQVRSQARCITYDHRGHSGSKDANRDLVTLDTLASDLNELVNGLGLSDITLLGWSMGAGVIMDYLSLYGSGALRQVVLCDMTPRQINDANWHLGLLQGSYTRADMERDAQEPSFYKLYKEFAINSIPRLSKVPGLLLRRPLKKRLRACDEKVLRSLSASMKTMDFRGSIAQIDVPLFYFYAIPGSLFSPELATWYGRQVSVSYQAVPFPNSTHMLIADNPELFAREVEKVLEDK